MEGASTRHAQFKNQPLASAWEAEGTRRAGFEREITSLRVGCFGFKRLTRHPSVPVRWKRGSTIGGVSGLRDEPEVVMAGKLTWRSRELWGDGTGAGILLGH